MAAKKDTTITETLRPEALKADTAAKPEKDKETPEKAVQKTIEEQILNELKELNKNIKALYVSAEDSRKIMDNMYNERRP
ncbi:MAG: hypothetical protein WC329_01985 [Candidatus Omnitrophota bacterium]|jgi:hypothetical protein